jgi:hypothetical protein
MTGFQHAVAGGNGQLVVTQLQSPNFNPEAQTGWAVLKNGAAYFFDVFATGDVTASSLIVDSETGGIFVYSGVPAFGNLVGSWANQGGTDPYGNVYNQGICIGVLSNTEIQIRPDLDAVLVYAE